MAHGNFWLWLCDHLLQAGMNVEYHQAMVDRMKTWELAANMIGAASVIASIVLAASVHSKKKAIGLAGVIGFAGLVVLFIPCSQWVSKHQDFQRQWSSVQAQLKDMQATFFLQRDKPDLPASLVGQKKSIDSKIGLIQAEEPKPDNSLLQRCWENQIEKAYGHGLRSTTDVAAYFKKENIVPPITHEQLPLPQRPHQN